MIIGECPYDGCNRTAMRHLPDVPLPAYSKENCEGCGQIVWVKHTRVDPTVWTEEDFLKDFTVNEETKKVEPR